MTAYCIFGKCEGRVFSRKTWLLVSILHVFLSSIKNKSGRIEVTKMKWVVIIIGVAVLGYIGFTKMEYIRCGGKFVRPGATVSEVLELCGEPRNRETSESDRIPLGGPRVNYEGQFVMREAPEESSQVTKITERWVYNRDDRNVILTFTGEGSQDTFDEEEPALSLKKIEKF